MTGRLPGCFAHLQLRCQTGLLLVALHAHGHPTYKACTFAAPNTSNTSSMHT